MVILKAYRCEGDMRSERLVREMLILTRAVIKYVNVT